MPQHVLAGLLVALCSLACVAAVVVIASHLVRSRRRPAVPPAPGHDVLLDAPDRREFEALFSPAERAEIASLLASADADTRPRVQAHAHDTLLVLAACGVQLVGIDVGDEPSLAFEDGTVVRLASAAGLEWLAEVATASPAPTYLRGLAQGPERTEMVFSVGTRRVLATASVLAAVAV